ncbi:MULTISPECIES: hypothetical protein [Microbulbifer]|uniref:Uncharacterized protein n=1 Tax=Microbulbifer celer TaxID=435905 RepID=A0ABW3UDW2_9GAMM|nr:MULTISPECIES: hypothetical protein [Microbulbifer]UFN56912.1 hypothetical protein LPW13_15265 [Microbulbifer celer]
MITATSTFFGEPVYSYTLKDGINDGVLTPFKVLPIVGIMDEYVYTPESRGPVPVSRPQAAMIPMAAVVGCSRSVIKLR